MNKRPGPHTSWLNSKSVRAIGQVMCEDLVMRKFFLEKFPNCFVNEGISFFGDYMGGEEEDLLEKLKKISKENIKKEEIKSTYKQIEAQYIKKMKLPSSRFFCPRKYSLPIKDSVANKELHKMFEDILLTSTQMINKGFNIGRLVELEAIKKEIDIYYCKTDKKIKMVSCCEKCEPYPLYSFEEKTLYFWMISPELFIEAMCSYVLQKEYGSGGVFCGFDWWDKKISNWRELDFVDRGKKWAVLCSKGGLSIGNEKEQISLCMGFINKIIFVSKKKEIKDKFLLFIGGLLEEQNFEEILLGYTKS